MKQKAPYHIRDYEAKRIREILYDYWFSEKDEELVEVRFYFKHPTKGEQRKIIRWRNPDSYGERSSDE